ncbi:non-specific lipid-transfer protein 3-like [Selaginella moellendorffii]|uniref:non-specific lipid-transfer protein 3-like n=1 Tax=Selaginella moellendorffii TaxID=88036 RepID=UPI000D1CABFA|nr:non-specific lipid-transfer protein 3-like [Selaginella moellendorffii]|eukprot:XP_024538659.1 non-specific lipid-transfer protein 3-like [Selaginella moellendorffii]
MNLLHALVLLLPPLALGSIRADAIAPSGPAVEDCQSLQPLLSPCVPYVQARQAAPSDDCCTGLEHVVRSNASCACDLEPMASGVARDNVTLAMLDLPKLCSLAVFDPSSTCNIQASSLSPPPSFMPPTPLILSSADYSWSSRPWMLPVFFVAIDFFLIYQFSTRFDAAAQVKK